MRGGTHRVPGMVEGMGELQEVPEIERSGRVAHGACGLEWRNARSPLGVQYAQSTQAMKCATLLYRGKQLMGLDSRYPFLQALVLIWSEKDCLIRTPTAPQTKIINVILGQTLDRLHYESLTSLCMFICLPE